ncbi:MAG: aminoglycoside phosphotransferase family protein, partial [Cruoricaptor ignavus]|nr:aminoglycoside phosphotransferase family protein [Cruoricaptor ignavus]
NEDIAYESARLLSEFYFCLNQENNLEIKETLPGFIDFQKRLNDYKIALENAKKELKQKAKSEIDYTHQHLQLPEKWIDLDAQNLLPKRLIHADPKISNLLFSQDEKAIAVIDLDTVMHAPILYDFGDMVRSYTNKTDEDDADFHDNFDANIFVKIKQGFLNHLEKMLTPLEIELTDYAAQVVIYIQAVRFLTDYLNGSIYYSTNYDEHNLDRTKNQINLLKGLQVFLSE